MATINLKEVTSKKQIAKVILKTMEINGIKNSELISGTHFSKMVIFSILNFNKSEKDYRLNPLLKVFEHLKIYIYIGKNEKKEMKFSCFFKYKKVCIIV